MNHALDFTLDDVPALNPDPAPIRHDPRLDARTLRFIAYLHRGGAQRFTQDRGKPSAILWSRTDEALRLPADHPASQIFFSISPATQRVTDEDRTKHPGLTDKAIESRVATKAGTVAAINTLFREFDAKDFTHPTEAYIDSIYQPMRADPANAKVPDKALRNQATGKAKSAIYKTDPAKYKALALAAVRAMNPAPSIVVASGGGYNAYCLLDQPLIIRTSEHDHAAHIQSYAEDMQRRFVHMDPAADQGVHDLRRVFRPPGTTNHKPAYGPKFPIVAFETFDMDRRYNLRQLAATLPAVPEAAPSATKRPAFDRTPTQHPAQPSAQRSPGAGADVIGQYNQAHTITELLEAHGYTRHGVRYMRPGGDNSPGVDIDATGNRSRHWSSNDPMYDPHWRSPFDVFCTFEHAGNVGRAVAAAAADLGIARPDIQPVIAAARLFIKGPGLAPLIGKGPGSKKARLVIDGLLDRMEESNRLTIRTRRTRIAALAGVSAATVDNVFKLLPTDLFSVTHGDHGYTISLNCRFAFFDGYLDQYRRANPTTRQKTQNDKNEYSAHKADDCFATGTSRYMKEHIKDLSLQLDISFQDAKRDYTTRGLGEAVLLAYDTWVRVGDFTAQEYIELTGLKIGAARNALNHAVKRGLAEAEREGSRGPKTYSFVPDFWDRIAELTPSMRTYRISDQREDKRLESAQQWAMRAIELATTPEEKLIAERRFAHLARLRLPHLARLHPQLDSGDLKRLAYEVTSFKRSPKVDQAIRTQRVAQRTEHRETVALIRDLAIEIADIGTPLEKVFDAVMRFGTFDKDVVRRVLQSPKQMANFETVESIKQRLRHDDLTQALVIVPPPAPAIDCQLRMAGL